jgi:hypothetical protein
MARSSKGNAMIASLHNIGFVRIAFCTLIGLLGAWFALALAISGVSRIKAPQAALAFIPSESTALSSRADQLYSTNPKSPPPAASQLARKALAVQAINAKALRILGYAADVRGDNAKAEDYVRMAARLSRREAGAQLWLIEYYAQANDAANTLAHYDILLTTKPETQAMLFARLSNAIQDKPVRSALLPYWQQDRAWISDFLWHVIYNEKDLSKLVSLVVEANGFPKNKKNYKISRDQERNFLGRLINEERFADAKIIFQFIPHASPEKLIDPSFDDSDRDARFSSIGWRITEDPNAGAYFIRKTEQDKPALSIFANSSTTQTVANKLLYLKPGSYLFSARLSNLDRGDGGFLRWQLRCPAIPAAPVWTLDSINASVRASFDIPTNCPVQFLDLIASGGKGQTGLEATVASVAITPGG